MFFFFLVFLLRFFKKKKIGTEKYDELRVGKKKETSSKWHTSSSEKPCEEGWKREEIEREGNLSKNRGAESAREHGGGDNISYTILLLWCVVRARRVVVVVTVSPTPFRTRRSRVPVRVRPASFTAISHSRTDRGNGCSLSHTLPFALRRTHFA